MSEQLWPPVAGKYGRTREGARVGPLMWRQPSVSGCWTDGYRVWHNDGHYGGGRDWDIISEWFDDSALAQPIDFSKIRVGDGLHILVKAEKVETDDPSAPVRINLNGITTWVGPDQVVAHIPAHNPAPRPIEVGCLVEGYALDGAWEVRLIDGEWAFLREGDRARAKRLESLWRIDGQLA